MYFYELEAAGELEPDGAVYGIPLGFFHEQSLEHSNNELSQAMLDWIGSYREFKDIAFGYTGLDDSLRDAEYYACGGAGRGAAGPAAGRLPLRGGTDISKTPGRRMPPRCCFYIRLISRSRRSA